MLMHIVWDVSPEIIDGWKTPNYYGLLFVTGIFLGFLTIKRMFKKEGVDEKTLDTLLIYVVIATILGARLGHVFFYDWDDYKNNLIDIFKVWEGGLASHGAAIAILIALFIFSKKVSKKPYLWILDRVVAPIAIAGCFIRLGNLMNSEIVGKPSAWQYAFKFLRHDITPQQAVNITGIDDVQKAYTALGDMDKYAAVWAEIPARYPTQIIEAAAYFAIFALLMHLFWKRDAQKRQGLLFGVFMIGLWGVRFLVEFMKEGQTDRDFSGALNTGQMLSIPFVLVGVWLVVRAMMRRKEQA